MLCLEARHYADEKALLAATDTWFTRRYRVSRFVIESEYIIFDFREVTSSQHVRKYWHSEVLQIKKNRVVYDDIRSFIGGVVVCKQCGPKSTNTVVYLQGLDYS